MKICHVSSVSALTARTFYRECVHTAELGYDVCLVQAGVQNETKCGVSVFGYKSGRGALARLLAFPYALAAAVKRDADIYHLHTPQTLPIGWVLKLIFRKKVVYDIFEDFPSMALVRERWPVPLRKAVFASLFGAESASCRLFDGIVTADPSVMRMYARATSRPRIVFYNLPSLRLFPDTVGPACSRQYDVVYSGGISERTGIYVLVDAIGKLKANGLHPKVLIFGYFDSESSSDQLRRYISSLSLTELFDIRGRVTPPEVPALLSQARIGVVPLQPIPKFLKNIPTKLFEYWACGLATAVSDLPPVRPFTSNGRFGFTFQPGSADELAKGLAKLIEHPDVAEEMGRRARQAVIERLNTDCERKRLGNFYERVLHTNYTGKLAGATA